MFYWNNIHENNSEYINYIHIVNGYSMFNYSKFNGHSPLNSLLSILLFLCYCPEPSHDSFGIEFF